MGDLSGWYLSIESRKLTGKTEVGHGVRRRHWYERSVNHLATLLGLGILLVFGAPAHGLSLNEQIKNQLDFNCTNLLGTDDPATSLGPNLRRACNIPPTVSGSSGGASGATQTSTFLPSGAIEERLSRAREGEDETGTSTADIDIGGGIGLFITGEYEDREKDETSYQDGIDSDNKTLTIGADYLLSEKLVGGMALSYKNEDGDFDSGGGFDNDVYGVFLYGSYLPAERFFVDVVVGYAYRDLDIERKPFYAINTIDSVVPGQPLRDPLTGTAKSDDADADEYTASLLLGYDHPIGRYTVGPRVGVQFKQTDFDSYDETGDSGLELRYDDHEISSLRSVLGLFASASFSTSFAVIVPQVSVDYIHEYEDDRESISAEFVEDLRDDPKEFKFETDDPQSSWLEIGAGLVAVFPNDVQVFANYSTYEMNGLYDSWTASAGVRLTF